MKTCYPVIWFIFAAFLLFTQCKKDNSSDVPTAFNSKHGDTLSHDNGQICMDCHKSGGVSDRIFAVAGSVYKEDLKTPNGNGTIYFWSGQGGSGTLVATLQVDGRGNFYTTSAILPGEGAYPQIIGASGEYQYMPLLASTGNCNSCHTGTSTPFIFVK